MARKFLIAGLGNIGEEYRGTRHNIGFDVVDALAARHRVGWAPARYAFTAEFRLRGRLVHLIKPTTYMNRSGRAVRYWLQATGVPLEHLLVIVDDVSLPFCRLRLRPKGGSAGHNGLQDIIDALGTDRFPRLRVGIGSNYPYGGQIEYVLGRWTPDESARLPAVCTAAADAVETFILEGLQTAMNRFNPREWCGREGSGKG